MKKHLFILLVIFNTLLFNCVQANRSEEFDRIISILNIPSKNIDGYEINEEIYKKYSLIVYGSPSDILKNQRWKNSEYGKWKNEQTGKVGEYRILGFSVTGTVVNNELFPDDYNSGIPPEEWNYIEIENALSSWNDTEKYQTKEQYEYMLNQNLCRNGKTYNITASSIGLTKARLEAYATWKTAGSIFTKKKGSNGVIWEATFKIPAMAANAELNSKLNVINGTKYKFEPNQERLEIPISYGAEVSNLGEYAKKEDIKSISSELELDNNLIDKVQSENVTNTYKENKIIINKEDYPNADIINITLKNTSIMETRFHAEAPMVSVKEVTLEIIINDKKNEEDEEFVKVKNINNKADNDIPKPIIKSISLYRKSINNLNDMTNLNIAKKTNSQFICAGQVLIVEAEVTNDPYLVTFAIEGDASIQALDALTKRFVYEEPKARNEGMVFSSLAELKDSYYLPSKMKKIGRIYKLEYIIPYGTKQTLNSWSTIRNDSGNALSIDKSKLFSRIRNPYKIKIFARNSGGSVTKQISLDVFERWDTIYNRNLSEYIK